ncbi:MAG: FtsX-like permease family protein [Oscillospiraceae bacterium]|nr:FtsX-like permease family protein [Oscillospiraceae bacterium]
MYLNILKKDLKRKRAMNVILLVFIILASMFVSSGVNNIISVTTALDGYFEMADAPDYLAVTMNKDSAENMTEILENASAIDELRIEEIAYMSQSNVMLDGKPLNASTGYQVLQSDRDIAMNYFLEDETILKNVSKGKVYASYFVVKNTELKAGDKITVKMGDISREFTFAGSFKDAALGSENVNVTRFILNAEDFDEYMSDETVKNMYGGKLCYIHTNDLDKTLSQISDISGSFVFAGGRELIKFGYIFDMIATGVILVISLILIAVSFVVLRFAITFTLSEEFREIGVMKAIGIRDIKIRGLYLIKYAALALIGSAAGLILSFPFGEMLMSVSAGSVIISSQNTVFINVVCTVLVVAVILLFCLGCTGGVSKMTPIDAVRNGQTGERFRKKSIMSLGRSKLGTAVFLALNDVVSSPKRYGIITLTFFLCLSLLIILSNTAASLKSGKMLKYFDLAECHIMADTGDDAMNFFAEDGHERLEKYLEEVEQTLAENGMPAECMQEFGLFINLKHGEYESKPLALQGTGTTMDMYSYIEGSPLQNSGEIALTPLAAKELRVDIGDTVIMSDMTGEREYIVTAIYQTMVNQGVAARFYSGEDINYIQCATVQSMQIKFTDDPDGKEINRRIEKLGDIYPEFSSIKTAGEWAREITGVADAMDAVKKISALLTVILAALITVLMERSFIAKEQGEIALMKAIGVRNGKIYAYHTLRFVFVGIAAVIIGEIFAMPLTHLCIDPIFKMMGLELGVDYVIKPLEIYLVFPLVIIVTTTAGAFLTSLYTRKIKSSDTANIE